MTINQLIELLTEMAKETGDVPITIEYDGPDAHSEKDIEGLAWDGESVMILEKNYD